MLSDERLAEITSAAHMTVRYGSEIAIPQAVATVSMLKEVLAENATLRDTIERLHAIVKALEIRGLGHGGG